MWVVLTSCTYYKYFSEDNSRTTEEIIEVINKLYPFDGHDCEDTPIDFDKINSQRRIVKEYINDEQLPLYSYIFCGELSANYDCCHVILLKVDENVLNYQDIIDNTIQPKTDTFFERYDIYTDRIPITKSQEQITT